MSKKDDGKVCYRYICPKYPKCRRARGKGCCIDVQEESLLVEEGECGAGNGYPLFVPEED